MEGKAVRYIYIKNFYWYTAFYLYKAQGRLVHVCAENKDKFSWGTFLKEKKKSKNLSILSPVFSGNFLGEHSRR